MRTAHSRLLDVAALVSGLTLVTVSCTQPQKTEAPAAATQPAQAAAQPAPRYNNKIPEQIMTPDTVETRIGTLRFFDGFPTKETSQKLYDNLDFMRGVETFLTFVPAASIEGLRRGLAEMGATTANKVVTRHGCSLKPASIRPVHRGDPPGVFCGIVPSIRSTSRTIHATR